MRLFYGTVATAIACLLPSQLHAIPAWSRLTGAPCSSCHATPTWQLNKDGLAFLQNGHRIDPLKHFSRYTERVGTRPAAFDHRQATSPFHLI